MVLTETTRINVFFSLLSLNLFGLSNLHLKDHFKCSCSHNGDWLSEKGWRVAADSPDYPLSSPRTSVRFKHRRKALAPRTNFFYSIFWKNNTFTTKNLSCEIYHVNSKSKDLCKTPATFSFNPSTSSWYVFVTTDLNSWFSLTSVRLVTLNFSWKMEFYLVIVIFSEVFSDFFLSLLSSHLAWAHNSHTCMRLIKRRAEYG